MTWDKNKWIEKKVVPHLELVSPIKNDNGEVSPGKLWSLKKEIFLYEYIQPYVNIIRGKKSFFHNWFYFDPFCGSGLFDLEVASQIVKFPGSPLMTYSRNSKFPFSDYYLADAKKKNLQSLETRMKVLFPDNQLKYNNNDFSTSVQFFDNLDSKNDAVLAIIDPPGFSQIQWQDVIHALRFPAVDAFVTIMTSGIQRNIEQPDAYDSLTNFFGSEGWVGLGHAEKIVDAYIDHIKSETGKHVERISIDMENQKLYDFLYITRNETALRIMDDIAFKLKQIKLSDLISIVAEKSNDVKTILDY